MLCREMKIFLVILTLMGATLCGCSQTKKPLTLKTDPAKKVAEVCKEGDKNPNESWACIGWTSCAPPDPEICKNGKWVVDEDEKKIRQVAQDKEEKKQAAILKHRSDLFHSLFTRVVSDKDMDEILEMGYAIVPEKDGGYAGLYCFGGCSYSEADEQAKKLSAEKIFQNALLVQFKIRLAAAKD